MKKCDIVSVRNILLAGLTPLLVATFMFAVAGPAAGQSIIASLEVGGSLTGLDTSGNAATYVFDLGYGDLTGTTTWLAQSDLSFTSLSDQTINGLLTATYNSLEAQLPSQYQSDLTLNLAAGTVAFAYPDSIGNPTILGWTSDPGPSYAADLSSADGSPKTYSVSETAWSKTNQVYVSFKSTKYGTVMFNCQGDSTSLLDKLTDYGATWDFSSDEIIIPASAGIYKFAGGGLGGGLLIDTPEPASGVLVVLGCLFLGAVYRMKKKLTTTSVAVAAAVGLVFVREAPAQVNTPYDDIQEASAPAPGNPAINPDGSSGAWSAPWTPFTVPATFTLDANEVIYLGLGNMYSNATKTVTLVYVSYNQLSLSGALAGYPDGTTTDWESEITTTPPRPPSEAPYATTISGSITPQPSWEWIQLDNTTGSAEEITITTFTSVCIPEPSTFFLLGIGAISLLAYAWRHLKVRA